MKKQNPKDVHEKKLDTLLKFSSIINSSLKIEDVLNHAMQWAEEFMDAEASTVYELDEEKGEIFVRIARGKKKEPVKGIILKVGEGVSGRVVQTGRPMLIRDARKEKDFSRKYDTKTGFETRSMICVPLVLRDKTIGALQVLNKKSQKAFTDSDLELLTTMSQQIAVALDNAKLYHRLEEKFELTERELKNAQEKLIRSERLMAMGHLVQGVAHEIRNPVTTIGGFAGRLEKELKGQPKLLRYLAFILEESERLENIVKQVHEFANLLSATLETGEIRSVLDQVIERFEPLTQSQGIILSHKIDKDLPHIKKDAAQLMVALTNVMENALESMPEGGTLTLTAKQDGDHILISILDTGCGIAQEDQDSVYDPFFTSKTQGAGLGLTMVHQIVMNHNGEIKIQSQEGKGTRVTLTFPVNQ
ncbi:MAG: GAF domain-containing protein [Deltaproteobacteria bacterium]|nr:GAF domain-containing protein [Deltaproteobacteria bacterium]MBW2113572.1 GAF domain-containing protein [Deltaproteobacteria bacterium]